MRRPERGSWVWVVWERVDFERWWGAMCGRACRWRWRVDAGSLADWVSSVTLNVHNLREAGGDVVIRRSEAGREVGRFILIRLGYCSMGGVGAGIR